MKPAGPRHIPQDGRGHYRKQLPSGADDSKREAVVVDRGADGSWEKFEGGTHQQLAVWVDAPSRERVSRGGLLGWLGFKKWVTHPPDGKIQAEELSHTNANYGSVPEVYNQAPLPRLPQPKSYDSQHYQVEMKIDPDAGEVEGKVKMQARSLADADSVTLDLQGFHGEILEARVDGKKVAFQTAEGELRLKSGNLPAGRDFATEVQFRATPKPVDHPSSPVALGWNTMDGGSYTLNGPAPASSWLPVNDDATDKATYDFSLAVPKGYRAIANGRLVDAETSPEGNRVFHYSSKVPTAAYLTGVHVLDEQRYKNLSEEGPLPIDIDYPAGRDEVAEMFLTKGKEMLEFLEERLGPYPQETFGAVIVERTPSTTHALVTLSEGDSKFTLDNPMVGAFEAQGRPLYSLGCADETTLLHETAHQWLGNSVSPASEKDIWISEGPVTYAERLWAFRDNDESLEYTMRAVYDQVKEHSFSDTAAAPDRDKLFSQPNYQRMEVITHVLRRTLGDDDFFATLRAFTDKHKDSSATVADFEKLAVSRNPKELDGFFEAWLHSKELPPYPEVTGAAQPTTDDATPA